MSDLECLQNVCSEAVGLLVTYRCNLHCNYCYIKNKQNKDMNLNLAKNILEPFLTKGNGFLDIIFMGGETLLAKGMIFSLIEWVESHKWARGYRFFGSTNGTVLDEETKCWLTKHKSSITLGLSYDGLPGTQENNRGQSDKIDIDFFIRTWPYQPIQMTINAESVHSMAEGIIYLLEKGAVIHPNVAYEETEWQDDDIEEYGRQLNTLIDYYAKHNNLPPITQFTHDLIEYADCIDNHKTQVEVCGAGNGFQVFDVDGKAYPCHILSPLILDAMQLKETSLDVFATTNDFSDPDCKDCPYVSSCSTCIACNYIFRGSLKKRDKTHCRIMKKDVKAYIKKEIIRLEATEHLSPKDATEIDAIKKLIDFGI